jgi:hypothetical protein
VWATGYRPDCTWLTIPTAIARQLELDDAQARGEITLTLTSRDAAAMTIGPMYYRSTIEHAPTDPTLIEAVINALGTWSTDQ